MPVTFTCPGCGHTASVPDKFIGQKVKCPRCGSSGVVPGTPSNPTLPPDAWTPPKPTSHQPPQPRKSPTGETIYYENDELLVTNTRIVIHARTYPLANVTSVMDRRVPPDKTGS